MGYLLLLTKPYGFIVSTLLLRSQGNSRGAPHLIALEQVLAILPFYLAILGAPNGT